MSDLKNRLHLTDYYLLDFDMNDIINFVKGGVLTREDVESVIDEYKAVGRNTRQELERCERWELKQHHFLESLRQAYLDGKIKTEKLKSDTSSIILKTKSLKSAVKRYCKKYYIDLELLRRDDFGRYYIKSFYGSSFEIDLSRIVTDEHYQDLLKRNQEHYLLNLLYIYIATQSFHRIHGNKYHNMYKEISEFQETLGFIVSDKILNNEDLSQDELDDVYRVFKKIRESALYAYSLSTSINKKYNK